MHKEYKQIVALDFELYNSKFYWTICWAGVARADIGLEYNGSFDILFNPLIKNKFIGADMTLPFSYRDLKKQETFGKTGGQILNLLDSDTLVIGHAFENDLRMLVDVCKKFGIKTPDFDYVDTNIIYNAAKGKSGEHSLKSLAEEFSIEFVPHNPAEDARAALLVCRAVLDGDDIYSFMRKYGIVPGGLYHGIIKKCMSEDMPQGQKKRIENFNSVCNAVQRLGQGQGKAYYLDSAIASDSDMSELVEKLISSGAAIAGSAYAADYIVSNNLSLKPDEKNIPLKSLLNDFGMSFNGYDFKPSKIRGTDGKSITLTQYYEAALKKFEHKGFLSGKKISFSRTAERSVEYEDCIIKTAKNGGKVCVRVDDADIFVLDKLSELNSRTDGRIRAYNYSRRAKILTLKDYKDLLHNKKF